MTNDPGTTPPPAKPDPLDLGAALAMLGTGFSEEDVVSVLGYMPDLDVGADDLDIRLDFPAI